MAGWFWLWLPETSKTHEEFPGIQTYSDAKTLQGTHMPSVWIRTIVQWIKMANLTNF